MGECKSVDRSFLAIRLLGFSFLLESRVLFPRMLSKICINFWIYCTKLFTIFYYLQSLMLFRICVSFISNIVYLCLYFFWIILTRMCLFYEVFFIFSTNQCLSLVLILLVSVHVFFVGFPLLSSFFSFVFCFCCSCSNFPN